MMEDPIRRTPALDRRAFLFGLAAAAGAAPVYGSSLARSGFKPERIVVVGAGMSGIATAWKLKTAGFEVVVLEGRGRIGGRIWTDRTLGPPLDLGASWIHGVDGNPMSRFAKRFGVKTARTRYNSITVRHPDGRVLTPQQETAVESRFEELMEAVYAERRRRRKQQLPDVPLGATIRQILDTSGYTVAQRRELEYGVNTTIEHDYAGDVGDMSLFAWDSDSELPGGDELVIDGYDRILSKLAEGLDVRLQEVVTGIRHGSDGVRITTNRGVFDAERAVVTLPVGVLRAGTVRFDPPLPTAKSEAIERIGMGTLNKLYLKFPTAFWAPDGTELLGYIPEQRGEWAEYYDIHRHTGSPVLLCFNAAQYGRSIETLADEQVVARAMETLKRMYGASIPGPVGSLVTRWTQDPFALGSYSYLRTGGSSSDRETLGEPVGNRLCFAGEATNTEYPATVHGAFLSGVREAQRISRWAMSHLIVK